MSSKMKFVSMLVVAVVFLAFLAPYSVFAKETEKNHQKKELTEEIISEVSPYITLNSDKTFSLDSKAYEVLDKKTLKLVEKTLKESNKEIKKEKEQLTISNDKKYLVVESENKSDTISIQATSSKHIKLYYRWHGPEIYFSHTAMSYLKSKVAYYGGGIAAMNLAVRATIIWAGLTPPGWLLTAVAGIMSVGAAFFFDKDNGCGVTLEMYGSIPTVWDNCKR